MQLAERVERASVHSIALAYEECLGAYTNNPGIKYIRTVPVPGDRNYSLWLRAVKHAEAVGCSLETYIKAQFYWFDRWWSTVPKPYQLSTTKGDHSARQRAMLYVDEVRRGTLNPVRPVVGRVRSQPKISKEVRFAHAERTMRSLMKNHDATEEEVLRVFAKGTQASCYFDLAWLRQNETYVRLKLQGEL